MTAPTDIRAQLEATYRRMALEGRYRPAAPSDGLGNITVPPEQLDLDAEARAYAASWWADEDRMEFAVGCCNYPTRPATVFAIEAARLLCGANDDGARRMLRLALDELEREAE